METRQLALITEDSNARRDWRLDDRTREVGRQGVAAAREALRAALARQHQPGPSDASSTPHAA